jgi:biopolymer transport protein TolQ
MRLLILLNLSELNLPAASLTLGENGVMDLIWQSGLFAKFVLLALLLLSILAWSITLNKYWQFRSFHRDYHRLINLLRPNAELTTIYAKAIKDRTGPINRIFEEGYITLSSAFKNAPTKSRAAEESLTSPRLAGDLAERSNHSPEHELKMRLETATDTELSQLESGLSFLASIITISPFLGLLGTVWGVMNAFLGISQSGSADLSVVAPGIAEALITTVAGLAVAIPAVLCYNFLAGRLRMIEESLGRLTTELNIYFTNYWYREKSKSENRLGHQRDFAR